MANRLLQFLFFLAAMLGLGACAASVTKPETPWTLIWPQAAVQNKVGSYAPTSDPDEERGGHGSYLTRLDDGTTIKEIHSREQYHLANSGLRIERGELKWEEESDTDFYEYTGHSAHFLVYRFSKTYNFIRRADLKQTGHIFGKGAAIDPTEDVLFSYDNQLGPEGNTGISILWSDISTGEAKRLGRITVYGHQVQSSTRPTGKQLNMLKLAQALRKRSQGTIDVTFVEWKPKEILLKEIPSNRIVKIPWDE